MASLTKLNENVVIALQRSASTPQTIGLKIMDTKLDTAPFQLRITLNPAAGFSPVSLTGYLRSEEEEYRVYREFPKVSTTVRYSLPEISVDDSFSLSADEFDEEPVWGINDGPVYDPSDEFPSDRVASRLTYLLPQERADRAAALLKVEMERAIEFIREAVGFPASMNYDNFSKLARSVCDTFDSDTFL